MNKKMFIKDELKKAEKVTLDVIENIWVGRALLLIVMLSISTFFLISTHLFDHNFSIVFLLGVAVNYLLTFSKNTKIREIALFFAVLVSICFLLIALISGAFLVVLNNI